LPKARTRNGQRASKRGRRMRTVRALT